ncbi:MAG: response regulator [Holophagaceae bacterium]|nr:response regulator [Holophagaceae bacterium]
MSSESNIKILYIEDNPVNYRLAHRLLSQEGFEMYWAEEGLAGFDLALQVRPHLILMDINLPGLSGFELTSKFRSYPEFKEVPIIALTAKTQKTDRETALVAGCNGFIPKPIDPFNFATQIKNYIEGRQERLDKGAEGRALRKFNVHLVEQLEQQLAEARESNQKLVEAQRVLEATNKSLTRLISLSQSIMSEHDTWQLSRKALHSLFLEVPSDSFTLYLRHSSNSYWEGLHLVGTELEEAPVLQDSHPFIQKLIGMDANDGWIQGPALLATPIWTDGYQLDIWQHNAQPCLLLFPGRKKQGTIRGFWAFDRTSDRPFTPLEFEMIRLYGRLVLVCCENAELVQEMEEKTKALGTSYEHLERTYTELQRAKTELHEKDRQAVVKDLFVKTANHLKEPVETLNLSCQSILREHQQKGDPSGQALLQLSQAATQIEAVFQSLLRRTQSETANFPEWIDLEGLVRDEIAFMEVEGLLQPNHMQLNIDLSGTRIYGIYSDFARLLRGMALNALPDPKTHSPQILFGAWREENTIHLELRDSSGIIHPKAIEKAFEPFQGQREPLPGTRNPHPILPQCRQVLATYGGSIDLQSTENGAIIKATIALGG